MSMNPPLDAAQFSDAVRSCAYLPLEKRAGSFHRTPPHLVTVGSGRCTVRVDALTAGSEATSQLEDLRRNRVAMIDVRSCVTSLGLELRARRIRAAVIPPTPPATSHTASSSCHRQARTEYTSSLESELEAETAETKAAVLARRRYVSLATTT